MTVPSLVPRRTEFATVSWTADDVLEMRPAWTRAQALAFLAAHESQLRDRLIEHGWLLLDTLTLLDS